MPSAVIAAYAYDAASKTLEIRYHSGKIYHYLVVPEKIFKEMRATMMKGIWFNRNIKDKYPFQDVTPGTHEYPIRLAEYPTRLPHRAAIIAAVY